jgi:adenylate cyclase
MPAATNQDSVERGPVPDSGNVSQPRSGLALMPTLMLAFGLLVLLGVGSVVSVQWITGRSIIQEFANRLIAQNLDSLQFALRRHLDPAAHQANFIAEAFRAERYDLTDPRLEDFISGTLAAAPQISGLILVAGDNMALRLRRGASGAGFDLDQLDVTQDPQLTALVDETRTHVASYWGAPVFREVSTTTFLNYRVPIRIDDAYVGFLAVAISTQALSLLTAELSDPPHNLSFMLYGRDAVLAHPFMAGGIDGRSPEEPLPILGTFGDLVIEDLASLEPLNESGIRPPAGADARETTIDGRRYFIVTQEISGYSDLPISVGSYSLASAVDAPLRLFYWSMVIAAIILGGSLIAAALIGGAISRPILRAAKGAAVIGALDFDKVEPLARGRFREINDLARSFNAMLDGLKSFGRYVPRTLVMRLIKEGQVATGSEERTLAIMFTDIAGFTATCEDMSAPQVAAFINHHLTVVSACIEHEGGTIDKYIGDAVMAFWGAPNRVENPAACACRAAVAIARAIATDNAERAARQLKPVQVRVGIHMGPVVVGDIGAPNRINYTIVGDAVNATQRLEGLGKTVDPQAEVIVLISRQIMESLPPGFEILSRGSHTVKGKHESLEVYQLIAGPTETDPPNT